MKEISLLIGNYNSEERYDSKVTIALHIMNIIISEKGKGHPNFPDVGIGLENYEFIRSNNTELVKLQDRILNEINRIIPDLDIVDVKCTIKKDKINFPYMQIEITLNHELDDVKKTIYLKYDFTKINEEIKPKIYL